MPIRPLTPADIPAYTALRREMLADSPWAFGSSAEDDIAINKPEEFRASLSRDPASGYAIIGAFDDARGLVGAAGVFRKPHLKLNHAAHIWGVYVIPCARGRDKGRLAFHILSGAIDLARSWRGVARVTLSVSENSGAARRLYQALGFVAWGTEPDYLRVGSRSFAEIHMSLAL